MESRIRSFGSFQESCGPINQGEWTPWRSALTDRMPEIGSSEAPRFAARVRGTWVYEPRPGRAAQPAPAAAVLSTGSERPADRSDAPDAGREYVDHGRDVEHASHVRPDARDVALLLPPGRTRRADASIRRVPRHHRDGS